MTESVAALNALFAQQKAAFNKQPMPDLAARRDKLKRLREALLTNQERLISAINQDFGQRARDETLMAEFLPCLHNIDYAIKALPKWLKPSKRRVGMAFQPAKAQVIYQPLGVIGIIVPWNYPLFLAIGPLIGALAAGNRAMIKMSESTPHTAEAVQMLLSNVFAEEEVAVVQGEVDMGIAFSHLAFDHLLFTGAGSVGKEVMRAAANNLTPVTLELGGKSPAIIGEDIDITEAAERIAFGKTLNAGQTCVAPDYVLLPETQVEAFVTAFTKTVKRFYPTLNDNSDYTAIINPRQLARLKHYLEDAKAKGATLISPYDKVPEHLIAPTLVTHVSDEMAVMQDEIFGPILPLVPYQTLDDALTYINQRPRPLALYYFGYENSVQHKILHTTHAGGVCFNDTLMHVAQEDLSFGGVGPSGMGAYHGHEGFLTFSHAKAVFTKGRFNSSRSIYPPYGTFVQKLIKTLFIR